MPRLADHLRLPLTRRFQQSIATIVARGAPIAQKAWDALDNYDESAIDDLIAATLPPMSAVRSSSIRQAAGYYTVLAGVKPPPIAVAEISAVPNMREPFISVWQALASGQPFEAAVSIGRSRLEAVTANLANTSARQTGDVFVAKAGLTVHGWQRITDPGACDWCQMVAENTYDSADSADFGHDRCGCTAAPNF